MSFVPDKIKSYEWYYNKLPLYLKNSYGFSEHFRIWYELLISGDKNGIVNVGDTLLYLFNIFDKNFLQTIANFPDSGAMEGNYGTVSDFLDKLGYLFGVIRNFSVTYKNDNDEDVTEDLSLNNEDFLLLIKAQIIKNYCEGTYEQIKGYYNSAGLDVFLITTEDGASAHVYLVAPPDSSKYSLNVEKMFKSGLMRIESMGITYTEGVRVLVSFLTWDSTKTKEYWDTGVWSA